MSSHLAKKPNGGPKKTVEASAGLEQPALTALPHELLRKVLAYLSAKCLYSAMRTCRALTDPCRELLYRSVGDFVGYPGKHEPPFLPQGLRKFIETLLARSELGGFIRHLSTTSQTRWDRDYIERRFPCKDGLDNTAINRAKAEELLRSLCSGERSEWYQDEYWQIPALLMYICEKTRSISYPTGYGGCCVCFRLPDGQLTRLEIARPCDHLIKYALTIETLKTLSLINPWALEPYDESTINSRVLFFNRAVKDSLSFQTGKDTNRNITRLSVSYTQRYIARIVGFYLECLLSTLGVITLDTHGMRRHFWLDDLRRAALNPDRARNPPTPNIEMSKFCPVAYPRYCGKCDP